jgi:putative membrane protein insertion efficiency factor
MRLLRKFASSPSWSSWLLITLARGYQAFLSPFFGGACRFHPSCSEYAIAAISLHGPRRGTWLAARRLMRCQPFTAGGYDPVIDRSEGSS